MKKFFKWFGIIAGTLVVLVVLMLLIVPKFVNVQKFKPTIEKTVQEATGRSFVLGGDLKLSLFPWAGITLKDVSMGNPEGFGEKNFVTFSEFEVRMKLLPLLSKDIQVKHVVLKGLRLVLERKKDGSTNWEFPKSEEGAKAPAIHPPGTQEPKTAETSAALPIKALSVGEISVTDGTVIYIDRQADVRKELSDVNIRLSDISLDTPIQMSLSGKLDQKPLSLSGTVGPLGKNPGEGTMALDLTAKAFDTLELHLSGKVTDPASAPAYQMHIAVSPFSPKKLIKQLSPDTVLSFSDPSVLEKLGFEGDVAGDAKQVALSNGKLVLDGTTTTLQAKVKDFSKPDIAWKVHTDRIDIDRYLPPSQPAEKSAPSAGEVGQTGKPAGKSVETDYAPLRSLVVDGSLAIDELKAGGGTYRDISMKVTGAGGKFRIDPLSMKLYDGSLTVKSSVDVTGKKPKSAVDINMDGVQIEPLLKDFIDKDFITGTTLAQISLSMTGDAPEQIKQSLNGTGTLQFKDGKIKKMNLLGMIQNLQAAFGSGTAVTTQETEFSEFQSRFTITDGVVDTTGTTLSSPVLKVDVKGKADLVKETLDFRVNPAYINPKNQKQSGLSISGNQVPVLVTGTFSDPKFRPDLESAAKKVVTDKLKDKLGEVLGGSKSGQSNSKNGGESDQSSTVEESVKGLLKSLPFGK